MRQMLRAIKIIKEIASRHKLRPPYSIAFVGQDGLFDNGRCDLLIDASAFQDFQRRLVDILESEPEDMRKFVIRFFSSVDRVVGTPMEKFDEEWIN
jgi:hypothetical protein